MKFTHLHRATLPLETLIGFALAAVMEEGSMLHLAPLDQDTWERELSRQPEATLFHTSAWLEVLARSFGAQVDRWGIYDGFALRGLLPVLRRRRGPFVLLGSPIAGMGTPYLGPLVPAELLTETLALLEPLVRRARAASMQVNFPGPVQLAAPPPGYRLDERLTLVLPLAPRTRADLWQGLKKNCRAHVRQAEKRGVEVFEADSPTILEDYFRLERQVFERRERPVPFPPGFYYQLWHTLRPLGMFNVFAARYEQRIVGVQINGWYGGKLYGLFGATDSACRQVYPGNLLEWHLIEWACARRLTTYDMVDGMDAGWSEFKRSFGAQEVPTPSLLAERSRAAAAVRQARHALRRTLVHLSTSLPRAAAFARRGPTPAGATSGDASTALES